MAYKSKTQPLCRYCGGKIGKWTQIVRIRDESKRTSAAGPDVDFIKSVFVAREAWPKDRDECQKLSNQQVVSTRKDGFGDTVGLITTFFTWDGESYKDEFFCNGDHAKLFGYAMARTFPTYGGEGWIAATKPKEKAS